MEAQYIVAASRGSGIIGILSEQDIRRGLAAGALQPSYVCLPAGATGDVGSQWRPLSAVVGPARPGGADDGAAGRPDPSTAGRESAPRFGWGELGWLLLTFGQVVSVLGCAAAVLYPWVVLWQAAVWFIGVTPLQAVWVVGGSAVACAYSAAMLVVFTRVKRLPPG